MNIDGKIIAHALIAFSYIAVSLWMVWKFTRPKNVCGPNCRNPDGTQVPINDRYTRCVSCPLLGDCHVGQNVVEEGRP